MVILKVSRPAQTDACDTVDLAGVAIRNEQAVVSFVAQHGNHIDVTRYYGYRVVFADDNRATVHFYKN